MIKILKCTWQAVQDSLLSAFGLTFIACLIVILGEGEKVSLMDFMSCFIGLTCVISFIVFWQYWD